MFLLLSLLGNRIQNEKLKLAWRLQQKRREAGHLGDDGVKGGVQYTFFAFERLLQNRKVLETELGHLTPKNIFDAVYSRGKASGHEFV